MKKTVKSDFHRRNERGVALLFALGILSLLLFIGLAFVADSVIALKIGANNSNRTGSEILARSALNNAAISVMAYQIQLARLADSSSWYEESSHRPGSAGVMLPVDFSTVVSIYTPSGAGDGVDTGPNNTKSAGTALPVTSPYRNPANTSYEEWYQDLEDESETGYDELRVPGWVYVTNGENNAADVRLIGRFAYRILPPLSSTRINLGYMIGTASTGLPEGPELENNSGTIYDFAAFYDMNGGDLSGSTSATNIPILSDAGSIYSNLRDSHEKHELVGTMDLFFNAVRDGGNLVFDNDEKRNWMQRWFDDALMPADIEAFRVTDDSDANNAKHYYYHRFPVTHAYFDGSGSDFKNEWDKAFGDLANATDPEASMDNLLKMPPADGGSRESGPAKFTFDTLEKFDGADDDAFSYRPNEYGGLPFFHLIGDSEGSFESLTLLRRQIAANFLDYCDSDSVPTSDVAPEEWSVTDEVKFPEYTGNEDTPYINEIAIALTPHITFEAGSDEFASQPVKLKFSAEKPVIFAELVKIYRKIAGNIADYSVQGTIRTLEVTAKVNTTVKVNYEYEQNDGAGNITWVAQELDYDVSAGDLGTITLTKTDPSTFDIKFTGAVEKDGYWVAHGDQESCSFGTSDILDLSSDLKSEITTAISGLTGATGSFRVVSAYVNSGVEYSSLDVNLELGPLMLTKESDGGVDFVRMDRLSTLTCNAADSPFYPGGATAEALTDADTASGQKLSMPFFIGGFEAKDPRQNLNPADPDAEEAKNDWRIAPQIVYLDGVAGVDSTGERIISMDFDGDYTYPKSELLGTDAADTVENRITDGAVNHRVTAGTASVDDSIANPSKAIGYEQHDVETVDDPAWRGDTDDLHLSTANIRNAPMQSFWELGAIHRAVPWQTLNLQGADLISGESSWDSTFYKLLTEDPEDALFSFATSGTSYNGGDGAILDMVKISEAAVSYGMIDLNMLRSNYPGKNVAGSSYVDELLLSRILMSLGRSTAAADAEGNFDLYSVKEATTTALLSNAEVSSILSQLNGITDTINSRSEFIEIVRAALGIASDGTLPGANKREQDELIGKIMPLLKTEPALVTTFAVDVVAQTIRDIGGNAQVSRTKNDGDPANDSPKTCTYGIFDVDSTDEGVYYDEITGETKFRAIYDCNPYTGKIKLRQIIPLED